MASVVSYQDTSSLLINDTILLALGEVSSSHDYKILHTTKGSPMNYGDQSSQSIDFPGEYGLGDIVVRCRQAGDTLHYTVRFGDETIAILLNPKGVEHDALKTANIYLCADTDTKERLEQNEFGGEVMTFKEAVDQA